MTLKDGKWWYSLTLSAFPIFYVLQYTYKHQDILHYYTWKQLINLKPYLKFDFVLLFFLKGIIPKTHHLCNKIYGLRTPWFTWFNRLLSFNELFQFICCMYVTLGCVFLSKNLIIFIHSCYVCLHINTSTIMSMWTMHMKNVWELYETFWYFNMA